ncbi:hypothetical protein EMN47_20335 [Prolixibacteraceae bacterium JC049]|nr:hypothetical protein [Prolixibacteraceae bacterium JC049]
MKSLALWFDPKGERPKESPKVESHINVWKLPSTKKKEFERFIDIGLLLNNTTSIKRLNIYYPTKINKEQVEDLGAKIVNSEDDKLINTLFNANFNKSQTANSDYYKISDQTGANLFSIYKLKESNIAVEEINHGTKISICFKGRVPQNTYIRIRINHDYTSLFSHIDKPSNAIFQSAFSKTEIIDFRINEARELSNELLEHIESDGKMYYFKKVHYFFICSSRKEYVFSHVPFVSSRQLEKERWKDYIGDKKIKDEAILAYHWKIKNEEGLNDFSALVQTKYENNSSRTIVKYIFILMLLTIIFNLLSNFIYDEICSIKEKRETKSENVNNGLQNQKDGNKSN